jgi:hypothetical protein
VRWSVFEGLQNERAHDGCLTSVLGWPDSLMQSITFARVAVLICAA